MAIQIGAKPDSGFDDPLGMLKDCHRRIERFLGILCVVAERAHDRTLTKEEKAAIQNSLEYFRAGGKRHTADEEESLFPRLLVAGSFSELDRLESDHAEATTLHSETESLYQTWISAGYLGEDETRRLLLITVRLRKLYESHIQLEESVVFPQAARVLDEDIIEAIGHEFRARRQ